ncbi:hypothetical protein L1987_05708 [Smallanthus sonchifolius]|uniref:Uncharacterized protein n=1 Tax=Smallanthus sonchifolius TaxID=185202 RepID=A0ACB9JW74_9ASTR|nr:hypothetical protein L1987_05708 [Smallanthus sonchifolius]
MVNWWAHLSHEIVNSLDCAVIGPGTHRMILYLITYSKEDEVTFESLFWDRKVLYYCHAWMRSMPCTNPDCLYLHEFGSQEDSFTNYEIISEYTRP